MRSTRRRSTSENRKDDFRRVIMNFIGAKAVEGKTFDWQTTIVCGER
jgi:serine protein kinase